jgi:hypothetical protein
MTEDNDDVSEVVQRFVTPADWKVLRSAKRRSAAAFDRATLGLAKRIGMSEKARNRLREALMQDDGTDAAWNAIASSGFLRPRVRPAPGDVR